LIDNPPHNRRFFTLIYLHLAILLVLLLIASCSGKTAVPTPTFVALAAVPDLATPAPSNDRPEPSEIQEEDESTPESESGDINPNFNPPTPVGTGVRPEQARLQFVPDAGPAAPPEFRPPPYEVPLSLHPDDHYWLSRPIPSNRRNYDLEWYPFGNDVLIPEQAPYRIHHGIDLPNEQGTSVLAAGSGTVIHAGPLPSPRNGVNYYGNTVIIQHDWQWQGKDVYTLYAHTLELFVNVGDKVDLGQLIAGVGSSGEVSSSHLHLEVRVGENSYAAARNPALWLAPYEGWGTLAGRFVDSRGRMISDATISVTPVDVNVPTRIQRTYSPFVGSDAVWRENFVVGDLPAGRYTLLLSVNGITYRRDVRIYPGRTTFEIISTQFEFNPTATPVPSATPEPTASSEGDNGS